MKKLKTNIEKLELSLYEKIFIKRVLSYAFMKGKRHTEHFEIMALLDKSNLSYETFISHTIKRMVCLEIMDGARVYYPVRGYKTKKNLTLFISKHLSKEMIRSIV